MPACATICFIGLGGRSKQPSPGRSRPPKGPETRSPGHPEQFVNRPNIGRISVTTSVERPSMVLLEPGSTRIPRDPGPGWTRPAGTRTSLALLAVKTFVGQDLQCGGSGLGGCGRKANPKPEPKNRKPCPTKILSPSHMRVEPHGRDAGNQGPG